jgi:ferritin-like protein
MSSESTHEPYDLLSDETKNLHRAIVSLIEELEAVDWYQQRASVCPDADLKAVLLHNRDEEIEHAMMNLEWVRRHDPVFDDAMKLYLFAEGPITEIEAKAKAAAGSSEGTTAVTQHSAGTAGAGGGGGGGGSGGTGGSLGIGSLRNG